MSLMETKSIEDSLPPWKSKGTLNRIGDKLRHGQPVSTDENQALDAWRAAHKHVMNGFQAMLRGRARGYHITIAQRHKRRSTIIDKLTREPSMQLARMDDVAGVRLIFNSIKEMYDFRNSFHRSRHKHNIRSSIDKYDYVKKPRPTGYRGVHDIYEYHSNSKNCSIANGLMIEVQYRTSAQHAWATANEIITMTTENRTKFASGDPRYLEFFQYTSELGRVDKRDSQIG